MGGLHEEHLDWGIEPPAASETWQLLWSRGSGIFTSGGVVFSARTFSTTCIVFWRKDLSVMTLLVKNTSANILPDPCTTTGTAMQPRRLACVGGREVGVQKGWA